MDYKITDPILDPPGISERFHSERLCRLPGCYFCFTPPPGYPEVGAPPALSEGKVTFGAFQNLAKVSPDAVALWSQILRRLPQSTLVIKARGLGGEAIKRRILSLFGDYRIGDARVSLEDWTGMGDYLARFGGIDIALDPMPFGGGTTTFHALWMGVPVVTLAGRSALGRMGASILQNVGLGEYVAATPEGYVRIAEKLAGDPGELSRLRDGMRERMRRSPVMDATLFARDLEAIYRRIWRDWCAAPTT